VRRWQGLAEAHLLIQGFFVIKERKFFSHVESLSRAHGLAESSDNLLAGPSIVVRTALVSNRRLGTKPGTTSFVLE